MNFNGRGGLFQIFMLVRGSWEQITHVNKQEEVVVARSGPDPPHRLLNGK